MKSKNSTKVEAWLFYDTWRKSGGSFCPALNEKVRVSLAGWYHLVGATGHKKRKFSDVHRRLSLLSKAKEILEKATTIQSIIVKKGIKYYAFDSIYETLDGIEKVRVIVIEDKRKGKIFLSIMNRKQKLI